MASKSLGTLTVDLVARVGGFTRGMTAAERQTDKTARAIAKRHKALAKELDAIYKTIGMAAAAAFATIGVSVKRSIDDMWQLVTVSKQIGMSADDFSALAAVAKDAEVGMDSLSTGLRTMARNLALAQQGSAQAANAFKAIGLDPAKLKDSKTAFFAISDALSKYRDGVNKTAIAQQIYGRSGAELIALSNQGSVAIRGLMDEQREMGNSVTPAAEAALAAYDDTADKLSNTITGLRNRLAIALVPALTSVNKELGNFAGSSAAKDYADELATVMVTLGRAAMVVAAGFDVAGKSIGGMLAIAQQATKGASFWSMLTPAGMLEHFAKNAAAVKTTAHEVTADIGSATKDWMDRIANFGTEATQHAQKAIGSTGGANLPSLKLLPTGASKGAKDSALPDLAATTAKMQAGFIAKLQRDITDGLKQYTDAQHAAVEAVAQYGTGAQQAAAQQTLLNEQVRILSQDMLPQLEAMGLSAGQALDVINKRAADLVNTGKQTFDAFAEFGKQAAANIQDSLAQFLFDPFEDGLKGMLQSLSETLRKMAAQMAAQAALKALFNAMSNSSTGWVSAIGKAFGGGKAVGGPVSAGTTYLIGEKGPELFTPSAAGTITANNKIGTGGGLSVTSNVTVNADSANDDPAAAKQLAKMIEAQTKVTVTRALQPGGILWKARNGVTA